MEIFKIIGIAFLTSICALIVKQIKPEFSILICLCGGTVILVMIINQLGFIIDYFNEILTKTKINKELFSSVLKIIGIGYLCEFSASLCVDSGCSSMGERILFAGKILILCMALPIITNILEIVIGILP